MVERRKHSVSRLDGTHLLAAHPVRSKGARVQASVSVALLAAVLALSIAFFDGEGNVVVVGRLHGDGIRYAHRS